MPRCLRSGSRQKKLQVQHIQQVNKTLRVSINKCIEANIDSFNQTEFLSLFGLTKVVKLNGRKNGQTRNGRRIKPIRAQHTKNNRKSLNGEQSMVNASQTASSVDTHEAFQIRCALECDLKNEQNIQNSLLAQKRSLLHGMHDAVADQRKCDLLYEQERRMNFILKISINELLSKMLYLCEKKKKYNLE